MGRCRAFGRKKSDISPQGTPFNHRADQDKRSALRAVDQIAPPLREKVPKDFPAKTPGKTPLFPARCKNLTTAAQHLASLTEGANAL